MRLNARFMSKHSKILKNRLILRLFFRVFTIFMYNLSIYSLICDSRAFKSRFFWFWCLILLKYAFLSLMLASFKFWILYKKKAPLSKCWLFSFIKCADSNFTFWCYEFLISNNSNSFIPVISLSNVIVKYWF